MNRAIWKKSAIRFVLAVFIICGITFIPQSRVKASYDYYDSYEVITVDGIKYCIYHYGSSVKVAVVGYDPNVLGEYVVIPETVPEYGYPVDCIGYCAFACNKKLKQVTINGAKEGIENGAFAACTSLEFVSIGANVCTVGYSDISTLAFLGCSSLKTFTVDSESGFLVRNGALYDTRTVMGYPRYKLVCCIPEASGKTTTLVGNPTMPTFYSPFLGNANIEKIELEDSDEYAVSDGVLFSKDMKTLIYYPSGKTNSSYTVPSSVTSISRGAFYNAIYLKELTIPDSVMSVVHGHGYNCSFGWLDNSANCYSMNTFEGEDIYKPNPNLKVNCSKGSAAYALVEELEQALEEELVAHAKSLLDCESGISTQKVVYSGKRLMPVVTVKDGSKTLVAGTDYTIEYENNINVGKAQVTLIGKGGYKDTLTYVFVIEKAAQNLTGTKNYTKSYGGKPFSLNTKLQKGSGNLTFTSSDKNVATVDGKGKVTIKGTGVAAITVKAEETANYQAASVRITLKVNPAKQVLKKVKTASGRKLTVGWKKDKRATGYQIQYSVDSKFKKGVKTAPLVKDNKTVSKTITKLSKGKRYYVRVRSYKQVKVNGKIGTLYGAWSEVKRSGSIKK